MGNVFAIIDNIVNWIAEIISSVIDWFEKIIKKRVLESVRSFLMDNEDKIKNADNPERLAKVTGTKKAIEELQKQAIREEKILSEGDKRRLKELFEDNSLF